MESTARRLPLITYPHPVLRKKASPVDRVTPELLAFIDEMSEMMYAENGVGLAAPQVGISLRIMVVDTDKSLVALLNPVIISKEGSQTGIEGCLSLPGLHGDVTCANKVVIRGLNPRGKMVTLSGEGLWARAMQHETDHLDGFLFVDKVIEETLHWITGETDADGNYIQKATNLEDALRIFELQTSLAGAKT